MFWITFIISGLIVASVPKVATHFNNRIAGYLVLVPVILTLSIVSQYLSHGQKNTVQMIQATMWGLPTLLVFGLVAIRLFRSNVALPIVIILSLGAWLLSILTINYFFGR